MRINEEIDEDTEMPAETRVLKGDSALPMRSGIYFRLEDEADRLLATARSVGVDRGSYLTRDQLNLRISREVFNRNGFPDIGLISGVFGRVYNPMMRERGEVGKDLDDEDA